jgi:hypothetical protein
VSNLDRTDRCLAIAHAFDEQPEQVLRLAGHLPPSAGPGARDQIVEDLVDLAERMTPENRQDLLNYARYRYQKQEGKPK